MAASRIRPCAVPRRLCRRGRNRTVETLSSSFRIARHLLAATVDPSVYKDAAVVLATAGVIVPFAKSFKINSVVAFMACGALLGVLVTLSSIGAGALGGRARVLGFHVAEHHFGADAHEGITYFASPFGRRQWKWPYLACNGFEVVDGELLDLSQVGRQRFVHLR